MFVDVASDLHKKRKLNKYANSYDYLGIDINNNIKYAVRTAITQLEYYNKLVRN